MHLAPRIDDLSLQTGGQGGDYHWWRERHRCGHGAHVVVADIQDELGASLCAELGPENASFVHCDVTDEADVAAAVDLAVARFGALDVMFNNAGIIDALGVGIRD